MAAGDRVPRAADCGTCALERTEYSCRRSHPAVRRFRQGEAGGDAQLWRIRRPDLTAVGYAVQISRLRERVGEAQQRVEMLMARQGHMIETVAINQLQARRERMVAQQTEARYGVADSYDRASRAQSGGEGRCRESSTFRF